MANDTGIIELNDLISNEALKIDVEYIKRLEKMIEGNKKFTDDSIRSFKTVTAEIKNIEAAMRGVKLPIELNKLNKQTIEVLTESHKVQTQIVKLQKEGIDLEKKKYDAEIKLEKAKQERLKTIKSEEEAEKRRAAAYDKNVQKQIAEEEKLRKVSEQGRIQEIKLQQAREKAVDNYTKAELKQIADTEKTINRYYQIQKEVAKLSNEYSNLATKKALGEKLNTKEEGQLLSLTERLNKYQDVLKKVDADIQKHQRNVGNYSSGWNGLQNSINQITREMPAFTFSMQTGFMGIANNIGPLADEIKRISTNVKELRAQGQKVPGVMSQLVGSLLTWQTALSIGITLLTVFGKEIGEYLKSLFKGKTAINELKVSQNHLNEAMKNSEVTNVVKQMLDLRQKVDLAKQGIIDKNKVIKQYNESLGKVTGKANSLNEIETLLSNNAEKIVKATLFKAAANYALEESARAVVEAERSRLKSLDEFEDRFKDAGTQIRTQQQYDAQQRQISENRKKRQDAEVKSFEEAANKQKKIADDLMKKAKKAAEGLNLDNVLGGYVEEKSKKASGKSLEEIAKEKIEIAKQELANKQELYEKQMDLEIWKKNRESELYAELSKDENLSMDERLDALQNSLQAKEDALKLSFEKEFTLTSNFIYGKKDLSKAEIQSYADLKTDISKLTDEQKLIVEKYRADVLKIEKDSLKSREQIAKQEADLIAKKTAGVLFGVDKDKFDELKAIEQQYKSGLISKEEYEKKLAEISHKYTQKTLEEQLKSLQSIVDLSNLSEEEKLKIKAEIAEKSMQLIKNVNDFEREQTDKSTEAYKKKLEIVRGSVSDFASLFAETFDINGKLVEDFIMNLLDETASIEEKIKSTVAFIAEITNALYQQRIDEIDSEIERTNEKYEKEISNATGNEKLQERLRIKQQADVEKLESKKKREQQKQANANKAFAIAQTIWATAQAIMQAYAQLGPIGGTIAAVLVGTLGAIQINQIRNQEIPKYEFGTRGKKHKGGPAELAEKRPEVVIEPGKDPYIVSKRAIMDLPKGTEVIPSIAEYEKLQKTAIMMSLVNEKQELDSYQANLMFDSLYGAEMLDELKQIRKQKQNIIVNSSTNVEIGHEIWKINNTRWKN